MRQFRHVSTLSSSSIFDTSDFEDLVRYSQSRCIYTNNISINHTPRMELCRIIKFTIDLCQISGPGLLGRWDAAWEAWALDSQEAFEQLSFKAW